MHENYFQNFNFILSKLYFKKIFLLYYILLEIKILFTKNIGNYNKGAKSQEEEEEEEKKLF